MNVGDDPGESLLLNIAIEFVDLPIQHGDFHMLVYQRVGQTHILHHITYENSE